MPQISSLTVYAVVTGSILLAFCLAWFGFPLAVKNRLVKFPRNFLAGRILAALDIALILWLLSSEGFTWVDAHRTLLYVAAPAAYLVLIFLMDEMLAARALGGFFLLMPFWIIKAAFLHPAQSRLLMTTFAYLMAVAGMVLVWSPYLFRKFVLRVSSSEPLHSVVALCGTLLGLAMIILGMVVY